MTNVPVTDLTWVPRLGLTPAVCCPCPPSSQPNPSGQDSPPWPPPPTPTSTGPDSSRTARQWASEEAEPTSSRRSECGRRRRGGGCPNPPVNMVYTALGPSTPPTQLALSLSLSLPLSLSPLAAEEKNTITGRDTKIPQRRSHSRTVSCHTGPLLQHTP